MQGRRAARRDARPHPRQREPVLNTDDARAAKRSPVRLHESARLALRAQQAQRRKSRARRRSFLGAFAKGLCATLAFGWVSVGGVEAAIHAAGNVARARPVVAAAQTKLSISWIVDIDGDGVGDLANPTEGPIRGEDAYGSGKFGAGRDKGRRAHHGVDYVAKPGAPVHAPISGTVTHLGYAYGEGAGLRSVELVNPDTHLSAHVLYVTPSVKIGDSVAAGAPIGVAQNLAKRYPGITNHVHVELRDAAHALVDAATLLPGQPIYNVVVVTPPQAQSGAGPAA
jgi:murein DD-endopeptidase MepM/ murein hydrolase activator NlpD